LLYLKYRMNVNLYLIISYNGIIITIVCDKAIRLFAFLYDITNSKKHLTMLVLIPIGILQVY
jgi:hypothetical protein